MHILSFPRWNSEKFLQCPKCQSLSLNLIPSEQEIHDAHGLGVYHGKDRKKFCSPLEKMILLFRRKRAHWLQKHLPKNARILDVGCGRGQMAKILTKSGYLVSVTELSENHLGNLKNSNVEVFLGPTALENLSGQTFNAISFFHVLEHFDRPFESLSRAKNLLTKDGQIFLEIPFFEGWGKYFKEAWFHLEPSVHLVHCSKKGLELMIQKLGLKMVESSYFSLEFSGPALFLSIWNLIFPTFRLYDKSLSIKKPSPFRHFYTLAIFMGGLLCTPLAFLLSLFKKGDIIRTRLTIDSPN